MCIVSSVNVGSATENVERLLHSGYITTRAIVINTLEYIYYIRLIFVVLNMYLFCLPAYCDTHMRQS